jgi:hypothetical protein
MKRMRLRGRGKCGDDRIALRRQQEGDLAPVQEMPQVARLRHVSEGSALKRLWIRPTIDASDDSRLVPTSAGTAKQRASCASIRMAVPCPRHADSTDDLEPFDDGGAAAMTAVAVVVATLIAVGGWFVVNALSAQRERKNDRRDYRARFLIDAWVTLQDAANRSSRPQLMALESAVAKIQLLGTARQIELAQAFSLSMADKSRGSMDALLADLRDDLRAELDIEPVQGPVIHLRIKDDAPDD